MKMTDLGQNIFTKGDCNVTFKVVDNEDGMGYLSNENTNSNIGLIVIQEWWGMNKTMVNLGDKYAKDGFRVLVLDIYRGKLANNIDEAGHLMNELNWEGAIKDISGAAEYLRSLGCIKVAASGYCMGGALTILAAANTKSLDCIVPYYGVPDLNNLKVGNISCPVLAMFGELDDSKGFSDVETAKKLEKSFQDSNLQNASVIIWPNAYHAFMNPDNSVRFNQNIADNAYLETVLFIKKHCN